MDICKWMQGKNLKVYSNCVMFEFDEKSKEAQRFESLIGTYNYIIDCEQNK